MTSSPSFFGTINPIPASPATDKLAAALLESLAEYGERLHGRRLWLACSGGRDSLALAALCTQLYRQGQWPCLPQLLHVNHGLQASSGAWAAHVAHWALTHKIPCQILYAQVAGADEQAARQARYEAMRAHINQDDVLLLAHHADDQAETVLMRLIQGAGVTGLSGMQPWRVQTQGGRRNILWRPWLTVRRADITAYAQHSALPYIDDPTNDTGDNVRCVLRQNLMPTLTQYNPQAIDNIVRSAQLLREAQATVSAQAQQDMQQTTAAFSQWPPALRVLSIDALQALPVHRHRQLLHHWLSQDEPLPPAKQLVDEVLYLSCREDHNHQTALFWQARKQAYHIRRYRQQLYRLSRDWLTWLAIPLIEHRQILTPIHSSTVPSNGVPDNNDASILVRASATFVWQLQICYQALAPLFDSTNDKHAPPVLKIAPLARNQRLRTVSASHPQSGKKLYQALGIPVWLRTSLLVISAVWADKEVPLLLLSPCERWSLNTDNIKMPLMDAPFSDAIQASLWSLKEIGPTIEV